MKNVIVIRSMSRLRTVSRDEVLSHFSEGGAYVLREFEIDTRPFGDFSHPAHWSAADDYLRTKAAEIREEIGRIGADAEIHAFLLDQIPILIAFGAYIGDEWTVFSHDYDRDRNRWDWKSRDRKLELVVTGVPQDLLHFAAGAAVEAALFIELSAESTVDITTNLVSQISLRPRDGRFARGLVQSQEDLLEVRNQCRSALTILKQKRPNLKTVHLVPVASSSVCFCLGQDLHIRDGCSFQTYRFIADANGEGQHHKAILVKQEGGEAATLAPLSPEEMRIVIEVRSVFAVQVKAVAEFSELLLANGHGPKQLFRDLPLLGGHFNADLFKAIPSITSFDTNIQVLDTPPKNTADPYLLDPVARTWSLDDRLLLRLWNVAKDGGELEALGSIIRIFLFHEYLHAWQALTKNSARAIGRFPNALERIDYIADTFALLHELAFRHRDDVSAAKVSGLVDLIDLLISSFYAFEDDSRLNSMQERRLRRYLNWYWKREVLRNKQASTLHDALGSLMVPPAIEISGLEIRAEGPRVFVDLEKSFQAGNKLEIGVAMETGKLYRDGSVGNMDLEKLLLGLIERNHEDVCAVFSAFYPRAANSNK